MHFIACVRCLRWSLCADCCRASVSARGGDCCRVTAAAAATIVVCVCVCRRFYLLHRFCDFPHAKRNDAFVIACGEAA